MASLKGKVTVLTGASRGVGKGIALGLGEAGATVTSRIRLASGIALAFAATALVVLMAMACSNDEVSNDAATPGATDQPAVTQAVSPEDAAAIDSAVRAFYQGYNDDSMIEALRHVRFSADDECGGATEHGFAYMELKRIEKLRYQVDEVNVNRVEGDTAQADVRISSFAIDSGQQVDNRLLLGFDFVRERDQWVYKDDPLPIKPFCP